MQSIIPELIPVLVRQAMIRHLLKQIQREDVVPRIVPNQLVQLLAPRVQGSEFRRALGDGEEQDAGRVRERDVGDGFDDAVDLGGGPSPAEIVGPAEEDDPGVGQVFDQGLVVCSPSCVMNLRFFGGG